MESCSLAAHPKVILGLAGRDKSFQVRIVAQRLGPRAGSRTAKEDIGRRARKHDRKAAAENRLGGYQRMRERRLR